MTRLLFLIAAGCGFPWVDRYLPAEDASEEDQAESSSEEGQTNSPRASCSGPAVAIGSLIDTSGTGAPYMPLAGEGGTVCSASCDESWFEVWISTAADCSARLTLPATVPASGLVACYGFTATPDVDLWSATCTIEVSGAPPVPRTVVW